MSDYLELIKGQAEDRDALVIDSRHYTYKELAASAMLKRQRTALPDIKTLSVIPSGPIFEQLTSFLAFSGTSLVPLLLPGDRPAREAAAGRIPDASCMAVLSSGTTGEPKILYRSHRSWADFFPIQNKIFLTGKNTRLFLQGPLAFTGNLNLYLSQLSTGGSIITTEYFHPKRWAGLMERERATAVYLLPAKLRALGAALCHPLYSVKSIIAGSQSMGEAERNALEPFFPEGRFFLYYGASELNYITYTTGSEMKADASLIGKPFPGVSVSIEEGELFVRTPYGAEGLQMPYSAGDFGHMDDCGNYYFDGRRDDRCKINGINISAVKVENALLTIAGISEAAVVKKTENRREYLTAYIAGEQGWTDQELRKALAALLSFYEIPKRFVRLSKLPKKENGKVAKKALEMY